MLNIIITYNNNNKPIEILNYINHINNINRNIQLNINIIIICFNTDISNIKISESHKSDKLNVLIYNYKCEYNDLVHNEIIEKCNYDLILYTNLNTFLVEPLLEYISLNKIDDNYFIRTNVIELENIPNDFYENYTNNIFNSISDNIKYICNEKLKQEIDKNTFIELFNTNKNIINISNENIKTHNLYYLNNSENFILIKKNILSKIGFNIINNNQNYTNQFLLLNLIHHNINMLKLPFILSVYTLESNNTTPLLDINIEFKVSNEYNKTINYKIHDIINNTDKNYIRNHIKQLNAVHSNDLVTINKLLTEENTKLKEKINAYEAQINNYSIQLSEIEKLKSLLNQKYIDLEHKYESLSSNTENIKTTYLDKLSIINSNINEIIINEKNRLFDN
tara:strand:- start:47 stop:1228 length:1182 start_codon:yes stop_codon:yes gene_type:complete